MFGVGSTGYLHDFYSSSDNGVTYTSIALSSDVTSREGASLLVKQDGNLLLMGGYGHSPPGDPGGSCDVFNLCDFLSDAWTTTTTDYTAWVATGTGLPFP